MSPVYIDPAGEEIWDKIGLHHDFDCDRKDAEVSLAQRDPSDINLNNADVICFHPDRIPAMIAALNDLHMDWKRANSPLYRDPSTVTLGDA